MKKTSYFDRGISVLVTIIIITLGVSTTGATLQVCKIGCDFSSINRALNESNPEDTIKIQNGNYSENLRIDKEVTLIGTNSRWVRIIPSNPGSPAVIVGPSPSEVEINNITVIGEGDRPRSGITVTGGSRLTLKNSTVSNFQTALAARDSSYLKVRGSEVINSGTGVLGSGNSELVLSGARITSSQKGLIGTNSTEVTVVDSEVTNCTSNSLLAINTAKINVLSSSITNNRAPGVTLKDFSRLNMEETQVSSNQSGGILLTNSAIANLTDNLITYNEGKNVSVISKKCGFSGPTDLFFGKVNGADNEIKPTDSKTICPTKFSKITSSGGGSYSYPFKPSTYVFIGLIGAASLYFLVSNF